MIHQPLFTPDVLAKQIEVLEQLVFFASLYAIPRAEAARRAGFAAVGRLGARPARRRIDAASGVPSGKASRVPLDLNPFKPVQ